jgi:predicted metal-dependent HD superfamily phosphohydrolase
MKNVWIKLCSKYCNDSALIQKYWINIKNNYTDNRRGYHNLNHIDYMYRLFLDNKSLIAKPDVVMFAIFLHDLIYNPNRVDNELKSAEIAKKMLLSMGVPELTRNLVYDYIIATKTHDCGDDNDLKLFLDFDLAILGANDSLYKEYVSGVRFEYKHYNDKLYNPARINIMRTFIQREFIYKTSIFRKLFEEKARFNIMQEIANLTWMQHK